MGTSTNQSGYPANLRRNLSKAAQRMHSAGIDGYQSISRKDLTSLKNMLQSDIAESPKETLIISKSNGVWQYYYYCGTHPGRKIYIPQKSIEYARQLATRDYYEALVFEIDAMLEHQSGSVITDVKSLYDIYENLVPARKELVTPVFMSDAEYINKWIENNPGCANTLEITTGYETDRGETVRSKSEKIIADKLYNLGIPYSYECRLNLNGGAMYPDFTILNIATRKTWYWEHFGLTESEVYRDNMTHKLNVYENNGLFLGDGLIITTEGNTTPLDTKLIGIKIEKYLLG